MRKTITLIVALVLSVAFIEVSQAYNKKETILGKWSVVKITRHNQPINANDPLVPFKRISADFHRDNKVILSSGQSKMPARWELNGSNFELYLGSQRASSKAGAMVVTFSSPNLMVIQQYKDKVKIYLKKQS